MELDEILRRKQHIEWLASRNPNPGSGQVNLDDMEKEDLKGLLRFVLERDEAKDRRIDELLLQLASMNRMLDEVRDVKSMLAESEKEKAKSDGTIKELTSRINELLATISQLQKELKEAKKYKKYKELYDDLRRDRFGSRSHKARKADTDGRDDGKDDWSGGAEPCPQEEPSEDTPQHAVPSAKEPESRPYRTGKPYSKGGVKGCCITHHNDDSQLPEGARIIRRNERSVFDSVHLTIEHKVEYVTYVDKGGRLHTVHHPIAGEYEGEAAQRLLTELNIASLQRAPESVPHTHASAGLLTEVIFNSFVMETPVYREMQRFMEKDFKTCRQTILNWRKAPLRYMKEILKVLKEQALQKDAIVNCDETWCRVRYNNKYHKGYIWCLVNKAERIVIFFYDEGSRGRKVLKEFIGEAEIYALQSDAYNVYSFLDEEISEIKHIGCMAHSKARFEKAVSVGKDKSARVFLDIQRWLYSQEKKYRDAGLSSDDIYRMRHSARYTEKVSELRQRLTEELRHPEDHGELMSGALRYLDNNWKLIMGYRDDGRFDIDNNIAERSIRPLTVERKNIMGFGSHAGAELSALYHTFIATCRQTGKSVCTYFRNLLTAIVEGRTDYHNLTPAIIG